MCDTQPTSQGRFWSPKHNNIIATPLFYTFPIFTMYKISQILPKVERLESPCFYDSNNSTYIQIHSLEAKLWRSGSCWVFVYLFSIPDQKRPFSVNSLNYGKYCISPDRSLRDEYDYGENVGMEWLLMEKNRKYSHHLECSRPPIMVR